jgi:YHS domain-containing protein
MRALFLVAGLVLAFIILSPMLRGWRPWLLGGGGGGDRPDQLVKDPFCGTYVLRSRAFRRESGGEALHFCSADCEARFARGERPV